MNIFNSKRQVAGYMLMCGGGASSDGGGSNGGSAEDGRGYSTGSSFTDEGGMPINTDNGDHNRFSGQEGESPPSSPQADYRSNGGEPMYSADTTQTEPAPTGISAGGDYSSYTTGTGYTNGDVSDAAPYAKDMTENEKTTRAVIGKAPILGQLTSAVEQFGKFIQPGGSLLKRGETGMPSASGFKDDYMDEDGNPIAPKKTGLINSGLQAPSSEQDATPTQQNQQQSYTAPQSEVPKNASASVDASMYGSGSGWGASIAKFAKAKQGVAA